MSQFLRNAEEIFATARAVASSGGREAGAEPSTRIDLLVTREGQVRIISDAGWSTEALWAHYAPSALYRVEREGGCVRVEGRAGAQNCVLESYSPRMQARCLLPDRRSYRVEPVPAAIAG